MNWFLLAVCIAGLSLLAWSYRLDQIAHNSAWAAYTRNAACAALALGFWAALIYIFLDKD